MTSTSDYDAAAPLHVFITAHPDDESMFFVPTIVSLPSPKWIICLSNGNYDELGKEREIELHRACGLLGFDKIICLNHPELQDGPTVVWSKFDIDRVLKQYLTMDRPIHLITFDEGGVSGHINHQYTCRGVQHFLYEQRHFGKQRQIHGWKLETITNPVVKYFPIYQWYLLIWTLLVSVTSQKPTLPRCVAFTPFETFVEFTSYRPLLNWKCMTSHVTQFVWYRRLFVIFSVYTYFNRLERMDHNSNSN